MFSMKTHKIISKAIHQHILSLRHEYLLRATCLSPKQPASLGELSFPWANQPPLKTSQLFHQCKNFLLPEGEIMCPLENYAPLPRKCPCFLGLTHLHIPLCNLIYKVSCGVRLCVYASVTTGRTDYVTEKRKVTVDAEKNDGKKMRRP